jgi:UDP-N-acetylmuramate dehydrogenase
MTDRKKEKLSLKLFNTFGIEVWADKALFIRKEEHLLQFLSSCGKEKPFLVLGDGSNVLFTRDYKGTILKMETKGIEILSQENNRINLKVKAGENWDEFVRYTLANNWYGLENLALIPGKTGSAPVQNIGAYGKEVKDFITCVYTIAVDDGSLHVFDNKDCEFGYRTSVFKERLKGRHIVTDVEFQLSLNAEPDITYVDLKEKLQSIHPVRAMDVYDAVSRIRLEKLPDYRLLGNAGSFFKNPMINTDHFVQLKQNFPIIKAYPVEENRHKMSAAQLIELAGWKGKRKGNAGVHTSQPLVLVNYGNATGEEVLCLAKQILEDVSRMFGIKLDTEVNII